MQLPFIKKGIDTQTEKGMLDTQKPGFALGPTAYAEREIGGGCETPQENSPVGGVK